jgi:uncharacterized repeat protein (TIGR01451 family)
MFRAHARRTAAIVVALVALFSLTAFAAAAAMRSAPVIPPGGVKFPILDEESEHELLEQDFAFESRRTAGDTPLSIAEAGQLRGAAARSAAQARKAARKAGPSDGSTFTDNWAPIGPTPIAEVPRTTADRFVSMNGRIGALAILKSGRILLGAAQGGVWTRDGATWTPRTDDMPSLAIGALAVAPNGTTVYAGTGEGAMSGDSYAGNGILKSVDSGTTWQHVSGDYFVGVSISRLVVDPTNGSHLYAAVLRGRGGARRVTPAVHSRYGIWESSDAGVTWKLLREVSDANGAADLEIDPLNPKTLYASFLGDKIYKSTNGGSTWLPIMTGLPAADYAAEQTRFSITISHPSGPNATLYAGFGYDGNPARVYKSTDSGAHWAVTSDGSGYDSVLDYCAEQCIYDNVIEADPTNPNVVFAAGQFDYAIRSGGIFRSDDGGASWRNLGYNQHPDFHALAFDPTDTQNVVEGSDGGVWKGTNQGGRQAATSPASGVTWTSLNTGGLQIAQFTSIATNPAFTNETGLPFPLGVWGGTQDNGTMQNYGGVWYDVASGDGGQALVDPTDSNFVYGTYYGVSPYRYTDGGGVFTNQGITRGIDTTDRSDFYIPWVLNHQNPNQLFLGTYRAYRTNTAKAPSAGDVTWTPISGDLTGGCTGTAPNGARTCALSAFGLGGGQALYAGSLDGYVWVSPDAQVADTPTWTRIGQNKLPNRPVQSIAVDRSNYRIAYVAYGGFSKSTPGRWGHVYKTTDGGDNFADISGNLPDVPVNSIVLDASYPDTLYAGTDVGPYVTRNGGGTWEFLGGSSFPIVGIWQLDLDPSHGSLLAGTHGRGAFGLVDETARPALVLAKVDAGTPVGPKSVVTYTLTVKNIGTGAATNVVVTDPVPANTTFQGAQEGGLVDGGVVKWTVASIAPGASAQLHVDVSIADALKKKTSAIVNDGVKAVSAEGPFTTGSPFITPIADPYRVGVSPATQIDGGRVGTSVPYHVTVRNLGFITDSYSLGSSGGTFAVHFFKANCTTATSTTVSLLPGGTEDICVKVDVPAGASNAATNVATVTATSVGSPSVSASASISTIAVAVNILVVDGDGNGPDVQARYTAALPAGTFSVWDLAESSKLPLNYLLAFKSVVWFTGNAYPGPITPYEAELTQFLDGGGNLFMSGQDILDQAAGTTAFVHDYLHIDWDGQETQNDKPTATVTAIAGTLTAGLGTVPLDHTVLGATFEDQITPITPAQAIFTDAKGEDNGLSVATGVYKVVFLAFPFEAYGTPADRTDLMGRVLTFFGP